MEYSSRIRINFAPKLQAVVLAGSLLLACFTCSELWAAVGILDGNEDFALLASHGFTEAVDGPHAEASPANKYAWSMAWFNGALVVGTFSPTGQNGGQIWRYAPAGTGGLSGTWKMVYQSPSGFFAPKDLGYRWMTVCDAGGTPRLYAATLSTDSGRIVYSEDGINFHQASTAGLSRSDHGYRPLVCFKDPGGQTLLITSPVGGVTDDPYGSLSENPVVMATDDPIRGTWRPYSPLRFDDPSNNAIFSIGAADTDGDG